MPFHPPVAGRLLERGVHFLAHLGPNGEVGLVAVDHQHRQLGDVEWVRPGESHLAASDRLWDRVERDDPFYLEAI